MKHEPLIGSTKVGSRGQMVLPKDIRDASGISPGDTLVVMAMKKGDEWHITLVKPDSILEFFEHVRATESRIREIAEEDRKDKGE